MKVCVSLLVYNEAQTLKNTIEKSYAELDESGLDYELWIFDNHSTDNTPALMKELMSSRPNLKHYRQPVNVGYAMSSQSSFKVPKADVYMTIDGDGQYKMDQVREFAEIVERGESDIVFGWRVKRQDPADRLLMSQFFNFFAKLILPSELHDMNCGYRAMSAKAAELVDVKHRLKFVGPEIFARAQQNGLRIGEREVRHYPRLAGESVYGNWYLKMMSAISMLKYLATLRFDVVFRSKRGLFSRSSQAIG